MFYWRKSNFGAEPAQITVVSGAVPIPDGRIVEQHLLINRNLYFGCSAFTIFWEIRLRGLRHGEEYRPGLCCGYPIQKAGHKYSIADNVCEFNSI